MTGYSNLAGDTTYHAFIWQAGVMADLGTLPGDVSSSSSDINDLGQVIGASMAASGNARAFLWQHDTMIDLNELIPANSSLYLIAGGAINSRSEITGVALLKGTTETHAFLATPCGRDRIESRESECKAQYTRTARGLSSAESNVAIGENVRKLLQRRLHFARPGFKSK